MSCLNVEIPDGDGNLHARGAGALRRRAGVYRRDADEFEEENFRSSQNATGFSSELHTAHEAAKLGVKAEQKIASPGSGASRYRTG